MVLCQGRFSRSYSIGHLSLLLPTKSTKPMTSKTEGESKFDDVFFLVTFWAMILTPAGAVLFAVAASIWQALK